MSTLTGKLALVTGANSGMGMATAAALAKLEPATLIFMGGIAGYIVIAIYIAMFSIYNNM